MGCDIHIVIQRYDDHGWREITWQEQRRRCYMPVADIPVAPEIFSGRNYDLFGILADVRNDRVFTDSYHRNGWPFFGILADVRNDRVFTDSHHRNGWPSIAPNRGLPVGFNRQAVAPDPHYPDDGPRWLGDHSFTYVLLEELQRFQWDIIIAKKYGVVSAAEYETLAGSGDKPIQYAASITGPGVIVYTPPEYADAKAHGELADEPYVGIFWNESARSATFNWPGTVIPWLEGLADGKSLRLVMGFDN